MTTIELSNGYFINIDPLNYTLRQRYTGQTKSGEPKQSIRTHGYYGDISKALRRYIELCQFDVLDGERATLEEYVKTIEQVNGIAVLSVERAVRGIEERTDA